MISVYLIEYTDLQQAKDRILLEYSRIKGNTYAVDYLPSGEPRLIANSMPNGYVSIGHTDGILAMAFSDSKVGVDIERADRQVSSRVCESIEKWTRIEAYAKWTGRGLSREMLAMHLPDELITTKTYRQLIVSLCADGNDFEIIELN